MSKKILVLRFSAFGDVAMVAPVLKEVLQEYPNLEATVVSQKFCEPIFNLERVRFYGIDLSQYKGFFGLLKLTKELSKLEEFDAVVDLHNVLRTKVIRRFFPNKNVKIATIGKGRTAKKKLTRRKNKELKPLKLMVQRYADVFADVDLPIHLNNELVRNPKPLNDRLLSVLGQKKSNWIGIAPFAKHKAKRMPLAKAEIVIDRLSKLPNVKIMLFGSKGKESEKLQEIASGRSNIFNIAGKIPLSSELDLMSNLDVMVSMDSANMHLASVMGTPVVSIWGGTHPYLGFMGYGQSITDSVQGDLECRPCSTFGGKPCFRGDYACLDLIDEEEILIKVSKFLM